MASEELDLVQSRRAENGLGSRMVFQGEAFPFSRGDGDHAGARKPRAVGAPAPGFAVVGDKMFPSDRDTRFFSNQTWGAVRDGDSPSGDGSDGEEEDDGEDDSNDDDEDVDEGDGLVSVEDGNNKANNNSSGSVQSSSEKIQDAAKSQEHQSSSGLMRVVEKDGSEGTGNLGEQQCQHDPMDSYENAIAVMDPEPYYTHAIHGGEGSTSAQKEVAGENGCGFSGRREIGSTAGYWESLRMHLSDPIT
ncbi:putative U-box domain-containing protein 62 [Cocos nucifera]|uniref:Putative U-box domain-containing protein 62 n=1 Tax=Cocos nucifera TaxID=13894 RepID=A0A8K0IRU2_COCNU|nr:putative U-box domain-containing protein 62 [Cocos nucifera]